VGRGDGWTDRCIHLLNKPADADALMTLQFDWGRHFDDPRLYGGDNLKKVIQTCQDAALTYFEALAEGSMFDNAIIGQPA
jgi:hypothetical protein